MENVVNTKATRTASIEYLELTLAYADFETKAFTEEVVNFFDDCELEDEKILALVNKALGKKYLAIVKREVKSGLYRIKNSDYVTYGQRIGEARESKKAN